MADLPTTKDWQDGVAPTASDFNTYIRNPVNFFISVPRVNIRATSNQLIGPEDWTLVNWTTITATASGGFNSDDMYNGTGNRILIQTDGVYEIKVSMRWEWHVSPTGGRGILVAKNSNNSKTTAASNVLGMEVRRASDNVTPAVGVGAATLHTYAKLQDGDYIQVFAFNAQRNPTFSTSGTPVDTHIYDSPDDYPNAQTVRFTALWVGTGV